MKLEQSQKDDLKSLTEHRGFKILEALVKEMDNNLLWKFRKANLRDEEVAVELSLAQNMLNWADYLINTAKASTKQIVKKEVK